MKKREKVVIWVTLSKLEFEVYVIHVNGNNGSEITGV